MIQTFRGTHDHLPEMALRIDHIIKVAQQWAGLYGYDLVQTPIFEYAEVFLRSLGETSDIVSKEMFSFQDRHGETLILRPEGTAGLMRALLSHHLTHQLPQKFFYAGPMFRYERPQKGRARQFHQIGIEFLGESAPTADGEVIAAGWDILGALGLQDKVTLHINSLGDTSSRAHYRQCLIEYFSPFKEDLSPESQERLQKNPLRILDSKDPRDQAFVAKAPQLSDSLNEESKTFFNEVLETLHTLKIPYHVNPHLVRGLDYYSHTIFEFVTDLLGAQGTVLAGGRYDGLSLMMGHKEAIPSLGWAAGLERLEMMMEAPIRIVRPLSLIPIGPEAERYMGELAQSLRHEGLKVMVAHTGNLKARMKYANRINASHVILFGNDELQKECVIVKNLDTGEQHELSLAALVPHIKVLS